MLSYNKTEQTKNPWPGNPKTKSRQELLSQRKKELLPHPSFDIDKDGFVSQKDYFISKQFDKDKDGMLNDIEKTEAENALKTGFLDKYMFGLESRVPNADARVIQQRGVIMDGDSGYKLLETYPMMRNNSLPAITSRKQMISMRKHMPVTGRAYDNVFRVDTIRVEPEGYVKEPKISSFKTIKESFSQTIRSKVGLSEPNDFKSAKSPSTEYVKFPKFSSQTQMKSEKKIELLKNLHEKADYNHISREEHLREREKYLIFYNEGKTLKEIKEQQRKDTNEYNQKTFSNVSIGVHGKELPTFNENLKEHWKIKDKYEEEPKNSSQVLFTLQKMNHAPIDKFRESDITGKELPTKPHTLAYKKKIELVEKPNHVIPYGGYIPVENTDSDYKQSKVKYKMSTIFGHFLESAAEMGINFIKENDKEPKTERATNPDSNVSQAIEAPKTSSSIMKKATFRQSVVNNPLRTTGFLVKTLPDS
ncbi:hypothetical protein SteCoe_24502 [Stentor coeruleus]|uniref:EF-hand domain-containing protein n=1 Tax=Stentor coeruleus TaxID=5963 RepID=A0A1R2BHC9_9CILI|nr:hypothetical protein SteCoe_24502 [Stentor coeruleus]